MKYLSILCMLPLFLLSSCGNEKHPDLEKARKEMKNRKLVRATDGDVHSYFDSHSKKMIDIIISSRPDLLQASLDSINASKNSKILYYEQAQIAKAPKEVQSLFEAYNYNLENKLPLNDNVQTTNNGQTYLYTRPVIGTKNVEGIWVYQMNKPKIIELLSSN